jgi:hypothetical protein
MCNPIYKLFVQCPFKYPIQVNISDLLAIYPYIAFNLTNLVVKMDVVLAHHF